MVGFSQSFLLFWVPGYQLQLHAIMLLKPVEVVFPILKAVLLRFRKLDWKKVLPVKFFGGIIAIGSGLALGREGPTVQMGGTVGDAISRLLKVSERERLTLTTAGAGAGLAAAFNAPLSGLIFILEEVRRDFQPIVFGATFVAAVIADIIASCFRSIGGHHFCHSNCPLQFPAFAIVRAPLTGIMLIVEMTGNYSQMLPLLVSCFCAYIVAEALKDVPIYEALLERDLRQNQDLTSFTDPAVVELTIQTNAHFVGKQVCDLGLPPGCILVRCSDGKREWVPKANTVLESQMHITAVIAPEASDSLGSFTMVALLEIRTTRQSSENFPQIFILISIKV